jgi:hypothetical protein
MTGYQAERARPVSMWAAGFVVFAGSVMLIVGVFHAIQGLVAIFNDDFYVVARNYTFDLDTTAYGWLHLILGVLVAVAGWGVFTGAAWARAVGMILAVLSAIVNFFFIPYYPVWAITIIALDVAIIWALTVWDRGAARSTGL